MLHLCLQTTSQSNYKYNQHHELYIISTDPQGELCSREAPSHGVITEVTTVVINILRKQIKTCATLFATKESKLADDKAACEGEFRNESY